MRKNKQTAFVHDGASRDAGVALDGKCHRKIYKTKVTINIKKKGQLKVTVKVPVKKSRSKRNIHLYFCEPIAKPLTFCD